MTIIVQPWIESESGWGQRSDGVSLHLSEQDRKDFIRDYWHTMPNHVPDEYSRPEGISYAVDIPPALVEAWAEEFLFSKNGIRIWQHNKEGWMRREVS